LTLRRALGAYLVALHLAVGIAGVYLLWQHHTPWLLALEAALLLSLVVGFILIRAVRLPQEIVSTGTEWLGEGDFAHSFRPTGLADLDSLVKLYNQMVARLREERIRQEEQDIFLHRVLMASPSGVITTDHDGRICLVNPAAERLLEISQDEARGRTLVEQASPSARSLAALAVGESRVLGQRGRRRLKCTHSQFFDRGFPRGFYIVEDLTQELWAGEKAAYDSLIRTLSHEVNNTVGAAGSILRSALEYGQQLRSDDRADFSTALGVAIDRMSHLNAFMQRYAEVARVPSPTKRDVDAVAMLRRIIRLMEPECRERTIEVNLVEEAPIGRVPMDEAQMEQVFVNVLRNALEAIDCEGVINVRVGRRGGRTMIAVEDSGPGLGPEAQANLFTPFFSTKPHGQGVGLTLVREILTLHGFDFSLESPPDGPTRFLVLLDA
jgi:two-component system nitrogen regulation sensor histidine kinase NtrY